MFLLIRQQQELIGWHSSGVTRTRIRVIGLNFSEILKRKLMGLSSSWWEVRVIGVLNCS